MKLEEAPLRELLEASASIQTVAVLMEAMDKKGEPLEIVLEGGTTHTVNSRPEFMRFLKVHFGWSLAEAGE